MPWQIIGKQRILTDGARLSLPTYQSTIEASILPSCPPSLFLSDIERCQPRQDRENSRYLERSANRIHTPWLTQRFLPIEDSAVANLCLAPVLFVRNLIAFGAARESPHAFPLYPLFHRATMGSSAIAAPDLVKTRIAYNMSHMIGIPTTARGNGRVNMYDHGATPGLRMSKRSSQMN